MNKTLWAVDNELDEAKFERLCVDLLHRQGFTDIVPIEPQDGGRDAEELPRRGSSREGHPKSYDERRLHTDVVVDTLRVLNEELKIIPK